MPATNPAIGPDLVNALRSGDEAALEQLFHARLDSVHEAAAGRLQNPVSAARVAERVFIAVWHGRASLRSVGDLEALIAESLRQAVVREEGRLAAVHRFEEMEHVHLSGDRHQESPSEEVLWSHVSSAIHAQPPDAERAAHLRSEHSRHATAEHVQAIAAGPNWKRTLVLGAGGIVLAAGIIWALDRASTPARIDKAFTSPDVRMMTTNSGQRGAVNLRDGGRVTLGPRSTLTIPPGYGEGLRVVRLEGSAQLSAADGGERIETRLAVAPVTVTGTSYSVSAYPAASEYFITANDSDAEVSVDENAHVVRAGDALVVNSSGAVREPSTAEVDEALGWTGGQFVVNERPLRDALAAIKLAYGMEIAVADSSLLDRRVSARGPITSSSEAIAALEQSGNLKFGYEGEQMMLRDAAAPDPRSR